MSATVHDDAQMTFPIGLSAGESKYDDSEVSGQCEPRSSGDEVIEVPEINRGASRASPQ